VPALVRQTVAAGRNVLTGQVPALPVQTSAMSQTPCEARHSTPMLSSASAGQVASEPLQVSARSQPPTAARHVTPLPASTSAGQLAEVPLQVSATSQVPAATRHTVLAPASTSAGQLAEVPVQVSGTSHGPAPGRQTVLAGLLLHVPTLPARLQASQAPLHAVLQHTPSTQLPELHMVLEVHAEPLVSLVTHVVPLQYSIMLHVATSAGHALLAPLQTSAMSQLPADARQVKPLGRRASPGQLGPLPGQLSSTSQTSTAGRQVTTLLA
jgi:hypothetical protein